MTPAKQLDLAKGQNGNGNGAHFDLKTGELKCPRCDTLRVGDIELVEEENRKLKRRVKSLEKDQIERRLAHRERQKILAAIQHWATCTGHTKANIQASDRFDFVVARRNELYPFGDPVEDPPDEPRPTICLAIEGIAAYPFATKQGRAAQGPKDKLHDRIGICLGSGEALERFARLGWQARQNGHH